MDNNKASCFTACSSDKSVDDRVCFHHTDTNSRFEVSSTLPPYLTITQTLYSTMYDMIDISESNYIGHIIYQVKAVKLNIRPIKNHEKISLKLIFQGAFNL